jgi:hypothetical protein
MRKIRHNHWNTHQISTQDYPFCNQHTYLIYWNEIALVQRSEFWMDYVENGRHWAINWKGYIARIENAGHWGINWKGYIARIENGRHWGINWKGYIARIENGGNWGINWKGYIATPAANMPPDFTNHLHWGV